MTPLLDISITILSCVIRHSSFTIEYYDLTSVSVAMVVSYNTTLCGVTFTINLKQVSQIMHYNDKIN